MRFFSEEPRRVYSGDDGPKGPEYGPERGPERGPSAPVSEARASPPIAGGGGAGPVCLEASTPPNGPHWPSMLFTRSHSVPRRFTGGGRLSRGFFPRRRVFSVENGCPAPKNGCATVAQQLCKICVRLTASHRRLLRRLRSGLWAPAAAFVQGGGDSRLFFSVPLIPVASSPDQRGSSEEHASSAEGADADENDETVSLTLQKTAELHGISPSYLSRRVKAGKPAKGHDLTDYAVIEGGRIEGFRFPPGYGFPAGEDPGKEEAAEEDPAEAPGGAPGGTPEGAVGDGPGGGHPGERPPEVEGHSPKEGEMGPYVDRRPAPESEAPQGFARSAEQFYAGRAAWGRLQRLGRDGEPLEGREPNEAGGSIENGESSKEGGPAEEGEAGYLEYVSPESPVTIERVSEVYGEGRYRLSRFAGGRELHFTFRISRQAPPVVERRLAKIDQVEHRAQLLEDRLEGAKAENERLQERLEKKEQSLRETEEERREEHAGRKTAERKLKWLQQDYDQELESEKRQLKEEMEKEVREKTADLEDQVRELEWELSETKFEHRSEISQLKHEHELEKIRLKNEREDRAIERVGRLAKTLAEGIESNPDVDRGVVWKTLRASGMEGLADRFAENWRQAAQAEEAAAEDASGEDARRRSPGEESSGGKEAGGGTEEKPEWSVEGGKAALAEQVTGEGKLAGPATREDDWWAEVRGRFPRRPENWCHDVMCLRTS